jgi:Xaa-Pro aminopeptidase
MAFTGRTPDAEVLRVWEVVRDARNAAIQLLRDRWTDRAARPITGGDADDAARAVVRGAGYGEYFVHRTGHSIDRELHGSGPHLDNFETSDQRVLVPGVGFSVEPGVYLPGRFGVRSEVNVFLGESGPEVTPKAQQESLLLVT